MSQASEEFTSKLTTLLCLNLPNATSMTPADKELGAAMLTQLTKQLGFVVAGVCHGDQQQMSNVGGAANWPRWASSRRSDGHRR